VRRSIVVLALIAAACDEATAPVATPNPRLIDNGTIEQVMPAREGLRASIMVRIGSPDLCSSRHKYSYDADTPIRAKAGASTELRVGQQVSVEREGTYKDERGVWHGATTLSCPGSSAAASITIKE
jgi:hypothetical protein